mmetsp:Transcript_6569/g.19179  ORF Transcript_6569/g.19179 Transcript_6569/m.19179 type:complete len:304 (-) Transcript_6569:477-1388(-)
MHVPRHLRRVAVAVGPIGRRRGLTMVRSLAPEISSACAHCGSRHRMLQHWCAICCHAVAILATPRARSCPLVAQARSLRARSSSAAWTGPVAAPLPTSCAPAQRARLHECRRAQREDHGEHELAARRLAQAVELPCVHGVLALDGGHEKGELAIHCRQLRARRLRLVRPRRLRLLQSTHLRGEPRQVLARAGEALLELAQGLVVARVELGEPEARERHVELELVNLGGEALEQALLGGGWRGRHHHGEGGVGRWGVRVRPPVGVELARRRRRSIAVAADLLSGRGSSSPSPCCPGLLGRGCAL